MAHGSGLKFKLKDCNLYVQKKQRVIEVEASASYDQGFVMWAKLVSVERYLDFHLTQSDKKNNKFCACGLGGLVDRSQDGKCPPMSREKRWLCQR